MQKAKDNPHYAWARIAILAKELGIAPLGGSESAELGAYDANGNFYDVAKIVDAFRARRKENKEKMENFGCTSKSKILI
jgi:hypothetical protein